MKFFVVLASWGPSHPFCGNSSQLSHCRKLSVLWVNSFCWDCLEQQDITCSRGWSNMAEGEDPSKSVDILTRCFSSSPGLCFSLLAVS